MSEAISKMNNENEVVSVKYDFVVFVSSKNGNPNGDPDNGSAPRIDTFNGKGIITDVSLKSHTRRAVKEIYNESIMIDTDNESIDGAVEKGSETAKKSKSAKDKMSNEDKKKVADELCKHYWDVRAFGAVIGNSSTPITGPVQIGIGESVHQISLNELAITRCIQNKDEKKGNSQFGNKTYQTYGLYRFNGSVMPMQARKTGFTNADLDKLFKGIDNAYTMWSSAQKGDTETVKIIIFKHNNELGCAKTHILNGCIQVNLRSGVAVPESYGDYEITVDESKLPAGVSVEVIE